MIEVKFKKTKDLLRLTVKGHAYSAERGKDLICAAASVLTFTVAEVIKVAYEGGCLKDVPMVKLNDGDAKIECVPKDKDTAQIIKCQLMTLQLGFELLARQYPNHIQVDSNLV